VSDHTRRPSPYVLGSTLLDTVATGDGRVLVTCTGCRAVALVEADEEPRVAHASGDCPVFQAVVAAFKAFVETSGSAWLA
jgi:hypothetical protein